jgi:hypothetical protein
MRQGWGCNWLKHAQPYFVICGSTNILGHERGGISRLSQKSVRVGRPMIQPIHPRNRERVVGGLIARTARGLRQRAHVDAAPVDPNLDAGIGREASQHIPAGNLAGMVFRDDGGPDHGEDFGIAGPGAQHAHLAVEQDGVELVAGPGAVLKGGIGAAGRCAQVGRLAIFGNRGAPEGRDLRHGSAAQKSRNNENRGLPVHARSLPKSRRWKGEISGILEKAGAHAPLV